MTEPRPLLFVHVMKTGGSTLRWRLRASVRGGEFYPDPRLDGDMLEANFEPRRLLDLPDERRRRLKVITGHFPLYVREWFPDAVVATMVRDPVERTVSFLRHARRHHEGQADWTYEQLYEDPYNQLCYLRDHQVKVFSLTPADEPATIQTHLRADRHHLERAKTALAQVDVLGVQSDHAGFVAALSAHLPVRDLVVAPQRVSDDPEPVPPALLERIRADLQLDVELYDHALGLVAERRREVV